MRVLCIAPVQCTHTCVTGCTCTAAVYCTSHCTVCQQMAVIAYMLCQALYVAVLSVPGAHCRSGPGEGGAMAYALCVFSGVAGNRDALSIGTTLYDTQQAACYAGLKPHAIASGLASRRQLHIFSWVCNVACRLLGHLMPHEVVPEGGACEPDTAHSTSAANPQSVSGCESCAPPQL